jgi:CheY-like chemotaxis protein
MQKSRSTILVLEYEPMLLALFKSVLSPDFRVLTASSRAEALEQFKTYRGEIDLLSADVALPDGSGIQVAWETSLRFDNLRMIITSAYSPMMWDQADRRAFDALPPASVALLQKPFLPAALLRAANDLIGAPQPFRRTEYAFASQAAMSASPLAVLPALHHARRA